MNKDEINSNIVEIDNLLVNSEKTLKDMNERNRVSIKKIEKLTVRLYNKLNKIEKNLRV